MGIVNHIGDVIIRLLNSCVVDHGFETFLVSE